METKAEYSFSKYLYSVAKKVHRSSKIKMS